MQGLLQKHSFGGWNIKILVWMQNTIHIMSIIKLGYWTVSIFKLLIPLILNLITLIFVIIKTADLLNNLTFFELIFVHIIIYLQACCNWKLHYLCIYRYIQDIPINIYKPASHDKFKVPHHHINNLLPIYSDRCIFYPEVKRPTNTFRISLLFFLK